MAVMTPGPYQDKMFSSSHLAVKAFLRLERSQEALLKVMASSGRKITPLSGEMFILKVFIRVACLY